MAKLTPSKRKQRDYYAEARQNTARIQKFCHALVDAFGYKAVKAKQRPIVYWLDSKGHLNHLRVLYKLKPDSGFENVPWIVRIYINHFAVQIPPSSLLELLGIDYFNRRDDYPTARTRGRLSQAPKSGVSS